MLNMHPCEQFWHTERGLPWNGLGGPGAGGAGGGGPGRGGGGVSGARDVTQRLRGPFAEIV